MGLGSYPRRLGVVALAVALALGVSGCTGSTADKGAKAGEASAVDYDPEEQLWFAEPFDRGEDPGQEVAGGDPADFSEPPAPGPNDLAVEAAESAEGTQRAVREDAADPGRADTRTSICELFPLAKWTEWAGAAGYAVDIEPGEECLYGTDNDLRRMTVRLEIGGLERIGANADTGEALSYGFVSGFWQVATPTPFGNRVVLSQWAGSIKRLEVTIYSRDPKLDAAEWGRFEKQVAVDVWLEIE